MTDERIIRWEASEPGTSDKDANWYWVVGIIAVGVAVASIVAANYLFALIAMIGGFAVMLAGSQGPVRRSFGLSERGVHIGMERIPYANIRSFAIREEEPRRLVLTTTSLVGSVAVPLGSADFRAVRTELKNRNIEEEEELESLTEKIAKGIGI